MGNPEQKNVNPKETVSGRLLRIWRKMRRELPLRIRNLGVRIHPEPVLLFGNYKTGSTVIAALLAAATGQKKTLDIFYRTPGSVKRKLLQNQISFEWFVHHYRYLFSPAIIKEPDLIFYVDPLMRLFPQGRFVFLLRDPRDNIRSILNTLHLPGHAKDLTADQINALPGSIWKLAMEGTLYGTRGDNYISTQALRWNRIVEIYERHADNMVLLKYETFVQNKAAAIYALAEQVGLRVTADIGSQVDVQYQPKGDRSVNRMEFYGRENLARIESICKNKMESYGYPLERENQ